MVTIVLVIHLLLALGIVGSVLMQRSEGGGLGIGGSSGGGMGGLIGSRASTNLLTRATAVLAGLFFVTSISLAILTGVTGEPRSIVDDASSILDGGGEGRVEEPLEPEGPSVPLSE